MPLGLLLGLLRLLLGLLLWLLRQLGMPRLLKLPVGRVMGRVWGRGRVVIVVAAVSVKERQRQGWAVVPAEMETNAV